MRKSTTPSHLRRHENVTPKPEFWRLVPQLCLIKTQKPSLSPVLVVAVISCPVLSTGGVFSLLQGGQWVSGRYAASLGHRDGPVLARSDGPRRCSSVRSI